MTSHRTRDSSATIWQAKVVREKWVVHEWLWVVYESWLESLGKWFLKSLCCRLKQLSPGKTVFPNWLAEAGFWLHVSAVRVCMAQCWTCVQTLFIYSPLAVMKLWNMQHKLEMKMFRLQSKRCCLSSSEKWPFAGLVVSTADKYEKLNVICEQSQQSLSDFWRRAVFATEFIQWLPETSKKHYNQSANRQSAVSRLIWHIVLEQCIHGVMWEISVLVALLTASSFWQSGCSIVWLTCFPSFCDLPVVWMSIWSHYVSRTPTSCRHSHCEFTYWFWTH